jgi:hypothetical protein
MLSVNNVGAQSSAVFGVLSPCALCAAVLSLQDRADLINCCLASSHIPFVMDWYPAALCRGRRCVDGSLLYMLTGWV